MILGFLSTYWSRVRLFSGNIRLFLRGDAFIGVGMTFWMLLFNLYLKEFGASLGLSAADTGMFIGRTTAIAQIAIGLYIFSTFLYYIFFRNAEEELRQKASSDTVVG